MHIANYIYIASMPPSPPLTAVSLLNRTHLTYTPSGVYVDGLLGFVRRSLAAEAPPGLAAAADAGPLSLA